MFISLEHRGEWLVGCMQFKVPFEHNCGFTTDRLTQGLDWMQDISRPTNYYRIGTRYDILVLGRMRHQTQLYLLEAPL